jgi:hypothetical protein
MATLTLRRFKKYFVIVAPDNKIVKFKTRREAKDWCLQHYRGSPVSEVADGSSQLMVRRTVVTAHGER